MTSRLVSTGYRLAEGPLWSPGLSTLFFVDILGKKVIALKGGKTREYAACGYIGTIALTDDDHSLACCVGSSLSLLSLDDGRFSPVVSLPLQEGMRFNDGKVAPNGDFIVGTMGIGEERKDNGRLYRIGKAGDVSWFSHPFTIPNGLDWWEGRFFHIDTPTREIREWREIDGHLEKVDSYRFPQESPDGMCISSSGLMYVALWGSGRVAAIDFDRKEEVASYPIGRKNVSSVAFGGNGLDTLYVTAGSDGEECGALFCLDVDDTGRVGNRWRR